MREERTSSTTLTVSTRLPNETTANTTCRSISFAVLHIHNFRDIAPGVRTERMLAEVRAAAHRV